MNLRAAMPEIGYAADHLDVVLRHRGADSRTRHFGGAGGNRHLLRLAATMHHRQSSPDKRDRTAYDPVARGYHFPSPHVSVDLLDIPGFQVWSKNACSGPSLSSAPA